MRRQREGDPGRRGAQREWGGQTYKGGRRFDPEDEELAGIVGEVEIDLTACDLFTQGYGGGHKEGLLDLPERGFTTKVRVELMCVMGSGKGVGLGGDKDREAGRKDLLRQGESLLEPKGLPPAGKEQHTFGVVVVGFA